MDKFQLTNKASKRTKERFKQHSPLCLEQAETLTIDALGAKECFLFRGIMTGWLGWIPCDEIQKIT